MGYIYIITSPNGKSYIGQTIRPIEVRLEEHRTGKSKECRRIYNAIKKHGWENFVIDWYYCPDEELNNHEKLMVEVLGTLSPEGYNLVEGGGNRGKASEETKQLQREVKLGENNPMYGRTGEKCPNYGKTPSNETKQKIGDGNRGKTMSEEAKQKIKKATSGENNPMYGRTGENNPLYGTKQSEDTKQKNREAHIGENNPMYGRTGENNPFYGKKHTEDAKQKNREANSGENNHRSKIVYQYDLGGTFIDSFASCGEAERQLKKSSCGEAERQLKKSSSNISKCALGQRKTAHNFKWSYTFPFI